ncbi:UNKNOWN [Stylonychia lemnae]|uniref:Uncharacterized protein n=1 Tax=Stylonychia lemnae TaxID=5949 RepID=A0A077ZSG0_STYLE|nr:UNKNOWN [Stylonychia lemnae]|eukprot:CDW72803.1 UNKNOWN [Stylonychia lemnae]
MAMIQNDAKDLEKKRQELDKLFQKLCNERAQDFNNILFSQQLNELTSYVDGLQKSSKVLKDELMSQTNLFNFRQLEFKSLYYQELIEGLQIFEKIERMIEEVEFLSGQQNLLSASQKFRELKAFTTDTPEIKQILQEFGVQEMIRKRIQEKQRILMDQINSNLVDFLFMTNNSSSEACKKRMQMIQKYFEPKFDKYEDYESLLEYVCKEFGDVKKIQEQFQKIHKKQLECANKATELINTQLQLNDEMVATGLLCLQKDSQKAIEEQNVAYLSLLLISFKKICDDHTVQEYLRTQMDNQMQKLFQNLLEILSLQQKTSFSKTVKNRAMGGIDNDVISELIQIDGQMLRQATQVIHQIFFSFQQNLSYFMIIDKQEQTNIVENGISLDYVNIFFYYFKFLIQILFDHDKRMKEFNLKNGISEETQQQIQQQTNGTGQKKPIVEKNMRFSFRNKEDMESFLVDQVRLKLDFYKTMEEIIVPTLLKKNISFVMTLGSRLIFMIDGLVDQVEENFNKESQNKQQILAFKGWMKRFIITNYEIFLDYYKNHSEFVAQKCFSRTLNPQNLVKTGIQDEKVLVNQSQIIQQSLFGNDIKQSMQQISKASIIGRINQSTNDNSSSMWAIFDYITSFSYVSQLAVEKIPLEDKSKQDQASFRQEILESVNKVMKKVLDKMNIVVNLCFNGSHRDVFFPMKLYTSERESYYFRGLIKREDLKTVKKEKSIPNETIDDQEFLYKPKLAMQNDLLSNSMTTLTLMMQIYMKINEVAIKEFGSCYQFISSQKLWEQLLSENCKKEYNRTFEGLQSLVYEILIFLRCEFTARAFSHMREMTRIDFTGVSGATSRVEPFVQTLIRDLKILSNFVSQYLSQVEVISINSILIQIFYLFSHLQKLVFKLYGFYVRFIKRQEIDESGFQRLKKSLFQLKIEFDMIVPKLLSESSPQIKSIVDQFKVEIAREYEKTIYILQLLICDEEEIEDKIKENDYGLTEKDFGALSGIQQSYAQSQSY